MWKGGLEWVCLFYVYLYLCDFVFVVARGICSLFIGQHHLYLVYSCSIDQNLALHGGAVALPLFLLAAKCATSASKLPRSRVEEDEDRYIRLLEQKLGYGSSSRKKAHSEGDEDGLEGIFLPFLPLL